MPNRRAVIEDQREPKVAGIASNGDLKGVDELCLG
jgi:hypothetical protein